MPQTHTPVDVANAYALLFAVTLLEYQETLKIMEKMDLHKLDWGYAVRKMFEKKLESK